MSFFSRLFSKVNNTMETTCTEPKWASVRNQSEMQKEEATINLQDVTIFFNNGVICNVVPDVYNYYYAQFYNINGKVYNTYSIESVNSIPVPNYANSKAKGTPIYNLEYLLNMRATQERKKGNNELAYALLRKSIYLMKFSKVCYTEKDFLRIVRWLYKDGYLQEAENAEKKLRKELPNVFNRTHIKNQLFLTALENCRQLDTELIYMSAHYGTCSECAKYQGRVYSISGTSRKFPPLPDVIKRTGSVHEGCRHQFFPYVDGLGTTIHGSDNRQHEAVKYSNRPFVDNRKPEEKKAYEQYLEMVKDREMLEKDRIFYSAMVKKYPDMMPKSLSGYRRMKKSNTSNYQKLVKFLNDNGIKVE